eukprot:TRINITY_DN82284_c0_g1_i1.p1 TRINITY_DN82284_c0_g1~~TRINITY_DN82284_c0_g1_i1.p1  ORF type:complete len:315 (-),score=78.33 TRINITY_DN82284_c0_g1_i1:55-999(-)
MLANFRLLSLCGSALLFEQSYAALAPAARLPSPESLAAKEEGSDDFAPTAHARRLVPGALAQLSVMSAGTPVVLAASRSRTSLSRKAEQKKAADSAVQQHASRGVSGAAVSELASRAHETADAAAAALVVAAKQGPQAAEEAAEGKEVDTHNETNHDAANTTTMIEIRGSETWFSCWHSNVKRCGFKCCCEKGEAYVQFDEDNARCMSASLVPQAESASLLQLSASDDSAARNATHVKPEAQPQSAAELSAGQADLVEIKGSDNWESCWQSNVKRCGNKCCCEAGTLYVQFDDEHAQCVLSSLVPRFPDSTPSR